MKHRLARAQLSEKSNKIRPILQNVFNTLNTHPDWYASIFFESKEKSTDSLDLQKSTITDDLVCGVVLRIYDGYTLFEQATDNLSEENLTKKAKELISRVKEAATRRSDLKSRPYTPPTWAERMKGDFESEIKNQIPHDVSAETPVHFGVRYFENPTEATGTERIDQLKEVMTKVMTLAPVVGLQEEDLTFIQVRQLFSKEESIFIDAQSNLSQTLYRLYRVLVVMSHSERNMVLAGGLGGLECVDISDEEIVSALSDLKSLKKFEKLKPGRYKVLLSPSLSGVLAHEAFGHSQEGDTCARNRSRAWDLFQSQEKVGNEHATIVNNPALYANGMSYSAAWGSYFFDEEGWLAQEQVILNQGKLTAPMTNLTSSIRLNVPRSANGKREDFSHGVYTRQTNTYFSAGESTLDELIKKLGDGFIITQAAGGMEDPKGMGIQVGLAYLKEVKDGKLTGRVFKGPNGGDVQMTGYTPDVLNSILGKSKIEYHQSEPDRFEHPYNEVGGCGKYHKELVYAGCGGPYVLLENIILG